MTQRIGTYIILAPIAKGGMAVVYRAVHETTGTEVALKLLAPSLAGDGEYISRFLREAKTLLGLNHPKIVRVYEANVADGQYFIAMELLGETLTAMLGRLKAEMRLVTQVVALTIIRQVALALGYAHTKGLVHRDVKPSNILRVAGDNRRFVLSDFGIVKSTTATRLTHTEATIGTPAYMSPEQITTPGKIDRRSDLYSLGVVLYEMLTGTAPYEDGTPVTSMYKIVHEELPPASRFRSDLTQGTLGILGRLLAKKPEARFQTGAEAVSAIDAALAVKSYPSRVLPFALAGAAIVIGLTGVAFAATQAQGGNIESVVVATPTSPLVILPTPQKSTGPALLIGGNVTATLPPTPRTAIGTEVPANKRATSTFSPDLPPSLPTATLAPDLPTFTPIPTPAPATPTARAATPTPQPAQATPTPPPTDSGGGQQPTSPPSAQPTATTAPATATPIQPIPTLEPPPPTATTRPPKP